MTTGQNLIERLMKGDGAGAASLMAADIKFRGVTPGKFIDLVGADAAVEQFNMWFRRGWREAIETFEDGECYGRKSMKYSVRWSDEYGERYVFEQHAYYEENGSGITWLELMCSGHRQVA